MPIYVYLSIYVYMTLEIAVCLASEQCIEIIFKFFFQNVYSGIVIFVRRNITYFMSKSIFEFDFHFLRCNSTIKLMYCICSYPIL